MRRVGVPRVTWIYAFIAGVAAALGARAVSLIDDSVATPIILILLVGVGVFVALNPKFGQEGAGIFSGRRLALAAVAVAVIGGYDGVFGPGTGMFLIMAFTAVFTQGFVRSAAMAKALLVFGLGGFINWKLALALAVANVVGAQLGARTVLKGGSALVRVALLGLVVTLCAKLGWDLLQHQ
ncbi:TSUP family transporter [Corynebacterium sp. zg-915]|uniref:Probable membrane transporter protein n=1 Tax=Corynebacterium wankanglinii TaxID=2735136 RepID=A0A838CMN9_9CORY|nr:TSUP family transporter [Corynebacterium wankanglinii]